MSAASVSHLFTTMDGLLLEQKDSDILKIWNDVKDLEFDTCFGAFEGMDIYTMDNEKQRKTGGVKGRLLESCKIYVGAMGMKEHAILKRTLENEVRRTSVDIKFPQRPEIVSEADADIRMFALYCHTRMLAQNVIYSTTLTSLLLAL